MTIILKDLALQRGSLLLFDDVNFTIYPKQRVGLVGKNGAGKSSLFALLQNKIQQDAGEFQMPKNWVIASASQEITELDREALQYVIDGDAEYRLIEAGMKKSEAEHDTEKYMEYYTEFENIDGFRTETRAAKICHGLGFSAADFEKPLKSFSGGWRVRLNLARTLMCRSDLLLLDEPTNHLDLDTILWLGNWLRSYSGTLIVIAHDREFLDDVVTHIVHIDHKKVVLYTGNYSAFEQQRAEKAILLQKLSEKQMKQREHLQSFVVRFKAKASKAKQAQSRMKALERMENVVLLQMDNPLKIHFLEPEKLPNPLLNLEDATAGYGDKIILKSIQLSILLGSRIGILGRNGAGKSTFMKMIASELKPLSGSIVFNQGLKIGYFAQHQLEQLHEQETPVEHLQNISPHTPMQKCREFLGRFAFSGEMAIQPITHFSGGEKARLALALIIWQKPNLLLLDEPTNHFDLDMRESLTIALQEFTGGLILVSHDRHLLRTTVDEFFIVYDKQLQKFEGDLTDYAKWLNSQPNATLSNVKTEENLAELTKKPTMPKSENKHPSKFKVQQLEKELQAASEELDRLNMCLADDILYHDDKKAELAKVLKKQAETKNKVEKLETEWYALFDENQ